MPLHKMVWRWLWVIIVLCSAARTANAQIYVDYTKPPATIEGQVALVDVVIRGRVASVRATAPRVMQGLRIGEMTFYDVIVTDVVMGIGITVGSSVTVVRYGGIHSQEVGFPSFHDGDNLVLILRWWATHGTYSPVWGPNSAFVVIGQSADGTRDVRGVNPRAGSVWDQHYDPAASQPSIASRRACCNRDLDSGTACRNRASSSHERDCVAHARRLDCRTRTVSCPSAV
jgi:hypothetical protein